MARMSMDRLGGDPRDFNRSSLRVWAMRDSFLRNCSTTRCNSGKNRNAAHRCLVFLAELSVVGLLGLHSLGFLLIDRFSARVIAAHTYHMLAGVPIFILIMIGAVVIRRDPSPREAVDFQRLIWLTFPVVLPFFCAIWGVLSAHGRGTEVPTWQTGALPLMLIACVSSGFLAIAKNRGQQRWVVAAVASLSAWNCLFAAFWAGMSVTGDWL